MVAPDIRAFAPDDLVSGEADLSSQKRVIAAKRSVAPHDRVTLTVKAFVQPTSGQLIWLVDSDAATQLKGID